MKRKHCGKEIIQTDDYEVDELRAWKRDTQIMLDSLNKTILGD